MKKMFGLKLLYFVLISVLFDVVTLSASAASPETFPGAGEIQSNLDFVWVLTAAAVVFMMQAGFMCLEAGISAAKHSINVAIKNMADFVIATATFWALGFGLMFGTTGGGWIGTTDFFISVDDPWRAAFFIFQSVFVGTAATIDSGAVAGRTKFGAYLFLSFIVSLFIYPIFGHWAWGGLYHDQKGWLEALGFIDFAGSTVVHSVGAWVSLAGVMVIGPRLGKFDENGNPRKFQPHNMTLTYLGAFILFFGWFGFNGGSTLHAGKDIAPIILNTMLSGAFGCISAAGISWLLGPFKRPEGEMITNGLLGGLVAVTAGCASVDTCSAAVIGFVAGIITYYGLYFIEHILKLDDVVGAIAVHGFCGAWGTVAVGIFISANHLGDTSRLTQIGVQCLGVITCFAWTFLTAYLTMKLIMMLTPLRVSPEDEQIGLNVSEHGASSTLIDLAQTMHRATESGNFQEVIELDVEYGTEMGDPALGFNRMIAAVKASFKEVNKQQNIAETEHNRATFSLEESKKAHVRTDEALKKAELEQEKTKRLIVELEEQRKNAADKREAYLNVTENQVGKLLLDSKCMTEAMSDGMLKSEAMVQSLHVVAEGIQKLSVDLSNISVNTNKTAEMTKIAANNAESGKSTVDDLYKSTIEIQKVTKNIDDISEQTQMLSLNAAITAAKTGAAGKSFGVVAGEVQALAKQTNDATVGIHEQVKNIRAKTGAVVDTIEEITASLKNINEANMSIADTIRDESVQMDVILNHTHQTAENSKTVSTAVEQASEQALTISNQMNDTYNNIKQLLME